MSDEKLMTVHTVKLVRRNPAWPKVRLVGGEVQRIMSEDSVPEYLYRDEQTSEWRELTE